MQKLSKRCFCSYSTLLSQLQHKRTLTHTHIPAHVDTLILPPKQSPRFILLFTLSHRLIHTLKTHTRMHIFIFLLSSGLINKLACKLIFMYLLILKLKLPSIFTHTIILLPLVFLELRLTFLSILTLFFITHTVTRIHPRIHFLNHVFTQPLDEIMLSLDQD